MNYMPFIAFKPATRIYLIMGTFVQSVAHYGNITDSSRIPICKDFMELAVNAIP